MKIGILQTGHSPDALRPDVGDYDELFKRLLGGRGFEFETFDIEGGAPVPDPGDADGWLITGSRHGAYESHAWIAPLEDLIRTLHARKSPNVGICFGHQLIAQALGGKVEKYHGGWSVGRTDYQIEGQPMSLMAWHQDQVTQTPPEARVVGASDFCANAALAYGDHIWTLQPHPEFTPQLVDGLIDKRGRGLVPDALLDAAKTTLTHPLHTDAIAEKLAQVLTGEPK
jgi:GMP synthase (glutamine-hydrolysing)